MLLSRLFKRQNRVEGRREGEASYAIYRELSISTNEEGTRCYVTFSDPVNATHQGVYPIIAADEAQLAQVILLSQQSRAQMLLLQQGEKAPARAQRTRTKDTNPAIKNAPEWHSLSMKPRSLGTFPSYDTDWWDRPRS